MGLKTVVQEKITPVHQLPIPVLISPLTSASFSAILSSEEKLLLQKASSMKAIIIARVSTEEQREAGNSLPAPYFAYLSYEVLTW